jgi:NAD(P)-dependent dehydrogenase (short-subunit alcohol dehydrogenase family)
MDLNLKGRRAVVTGSTGGIGYAAARELAALRVDGGVVRAIP